MADIKTVGVIGAGQMGNGIAHVFALAGYDVLLNDIDEARITAALATIEKNLSRQAAKGLIGDAAAKDALAQISVAPEFSALADCDLVIESATENQKVKTEIFEALIKILKKDAIMASNTSPPTGRRGLSVFTS